MNLIEKLAPCFGLILLISCSSLSKEECVQGNWHALGIQDGLKAKALDTFQSYVKDCAEYKVKPNYQEYIKGRDQGLSQFCENEGHSLGSKGQNLNFNSNCIKESLQRAYKKGHSNGLKSYCTFDQGYRMGNSGAHNNSSICPRKVKHQFELGYNKGIREFCHPDNAYRLALEGKTGDWNLCPSSMRTAFREASSKGALVHAKRKQVKKLDDELKNMSKEIKEIQGRIPTIANPEEKVKSEIRLEELKRAFYRKELEWELASKDLKKYE